MIEPIVAVIEAYNPEGDEGKTPVTVDYEF